MGLSSVLKVKTAHSGFPKQLCLGDLKSRNGSVWYKLELELNGTKRKVFAGGHMDRAPLVLVASCSTSLYGGTKQRYRSRLVGREQQRVVYTLEQPKKHALYRNHFNAVDVTNRQSQGPGCLSSAWSTYNVRHRLFAASLSTCVTNTYSAWLQVHQITTQHYLQKKFKLELADSMIKLKLN
jgi:hypothetical protein